MSWASKRGRRRTPKFNLIGVPAWALGQQIRVLPMNGQSPNWRDSTGMQATPFLSKLTRRAASLGGTVVMDAGALQIGLRASPSNPFVLTPHAGEMAQLCGAKKDAVLADPQTHAVEMARATRSVVALKGPDTWIASPEGGIWLHRGGVSGLGTSGSGDVLAGLIAGFAARGMPALDAALWGVWVHAEAGRVLGRTVGRLGFLAREIGQTVPRILNRFA